MAIPSEKTPKINDLLSAIAGRNRVETIKSNKCMLCDGPATGFRDLLSQKEYTISGMCQACQDKTWRRGAE